jgi:hypothetical protein
MKIGSLAFGLFVIMTFLTQDARACSCSPPPSKEMEAKMVSAPIDPETRRFWLEEFEGAVFVGNVIKIEKVHVTWFDKRTRMKRVTVNVEKSWLGVKQKTFVIYTSLGKNGDCGVPYVKGQKYFFYAPIIGGQLWTNICSPADPDNYMTRMFEKMFGDERSFLQSVAKYGCRVKELIGKQCGARFSKS